MAGHSKWNNIKRRKEAVDDKRGKIFSKMGREIQVAVREGGPNPEINATLQNVIAKAKSYNMPNDSIQRSIERAAGEGNEDQLEDILYEGYGPGGVAVMMRALTDNRNRTAGEIRHIFDKYGGNLGTSGCVAFQFERKGTFVIERDDDIDPEAVFMDALEAGAEDVILDDENIIEIITEPQDFSQVRKALEPSYKFVEQDLGYRPQSYVTLSDEEASNNMEKLIEMLEDNDDVQDVYHNWEDDED
ncbi:MAG: YebC/PmpR family DNA-binding transcriptional regulator [Saccharofermentanales bacterium]|jgi:YebC/PmpR family DNA-binding regulatory protein